MTAAAGRLTRMATEVTTYDLLHLRIHSTGSLVGASRSNGYYLVYCYRRKVHGHMERQMSYAEEPTLKYLIAILKDAKKTGAGR